MRFISLLATGAYLSALVDASPIVEVTNRLMKRELVPRASYAYQGCYSEGTLNGIGAGKALIGKTIAAPVNGITIEYCAMSCAGYVLFGLETDTCYCGNRLEFGVLPVTEPTCSVACPGNVAQFCGNTLTLSLYLIQGAGAPGPQGLQGVPGANGASGAPGATGATGQNGQPGENGEPGQVGSTGEQGPQGEVGPQGIQGATGAAGAKGPIGNTGAQGTNGANGVNGAPGVPGATGPKGDMGQAGINGINGATGNPGQPGAVGATGPAGQAGPQGPAGSNGAQGLTGPTGNTGPTGLSGACRPVGRDMGFEALSSATYDLPWDVSAGVAPGVIYDFQSSLEPFSGSRHALVDFSDTTTGKTGKFQQQDIALCPGTTYTFTASLKWLTSETSIAPALCVVYFNIGSLGNFAELTTYPPRGALELEEPIPKEALPVTYTTYTGTYVATLGDEDSILDVEIDCADNPGNVGQILFDTFRLAPQAL